MIIPQASGFKPFFAFAGVVAFTILLFFLFGNIRNWKLIDFQQNKKLAITVKNKEDFFSMEPFRGSVLGYQDLPVSSLSADKNQGPEINIFIEMESGKLICVEKFDIRIESISALKDMVAKRQRYNFPHDIYRLRSTILWD